MFETDREPDHVNEQGTKWWLDEQPTVYAQKEDHLGTALPNVQCFIVEATDGVRNRVVVENGAVIFDNPNLEAIGAHIDMLKVHKRFIENAEKTNNPVKRTRI